MTECTFPLGGLQTLEKLSAWISAQTGEVTVKFCPGTYYGTLRLEGLHCRALTLAAPDGATLTGCRELRAEFSPCGGGLLSAQIGRGLCPERLKMDGELKILARYPKYRPGELLGGTVSYADLCRRISGEPELSGAYLHSLHEHEWGSNDYRITGRDGDRPRLEWIGNNNRGSRMKADSVYVENLPSLLTDPEEWYYSGRTGELFRTRDGLSAGVHTVGLLDRCCLLVIRDCPDTDICVNGINFTDTDRSLFRSPWERYLRSDWAFNRASTVEIRNSSRIRLCGCTFEQLGSNGVGIFGDCKGICLDNCVFQNSLTNGVLILGDPDCTYCTSSWEGARHLTRMESPGKIGPAARSYPGQIQIQSCLFANLGLEDKQSAGVCISLAHRVTIDRCTFHHLPRAGINICENAFGGHTVSNCDLFDCVRETGDHGPFNSWGRDRFWTLGDAANRTGKHGKIKKPHALDDMLEPNRLIHNRVVGSRGFGIDLDDGSSNYTIEDNLCIGVGIKLREGFYRTVRHNLILDAPLDLHATYAGNDDVITGNIVCCRSPLRPILLNRGFTTRVEHNFFVNADPAARRQRMIRGRKNTFLSADARQLLDSGGALEGFVPLSGDFGRPGAPQPVFPGLTHQAEARTLRSRLGRFSAVDESIRSFTGAPGREGVYVRSLPLLSPLRRMGIRKGDVLLELDGETLTPGHADLARLRRGHTVSIFRNNQKITLSI